MYTAVQKCSIICVFLCILANFETLPKIEILTDFDGWIRFEKLEPFSLTVKYKLKKILLRIFEKFIIVHMSEKTSTSWREISADMPTMLNILKICNMVHYGLYFTSFPNLVQPSKYVKISIFGKVSKFAKIQRNTQIIEHFWKAV